MVEFASLNETSRHVANCSTQERAQCVGLYRDPALSDARCMDKERLLRIGVNLYQAAWLEPFPVSRLFSGYEQVRPLLSIYYHLSQKKNLLKSGKCHRGLR